MNEAERPETPEPQSDPEGPAAGDGAPTEREETNGTGLRASARGTAHHHEWRRPFLETFAKVANVSDACEIAGVSRSHVYRVRKEDPEFAAEWLEAEAQAADRIHREMIQRAIVGVDEPVFGPTYDGETGKRTGTGVVGHVTRYSDRLLERLAEAHMPDRFARRMEHRHGALDPSQDVDAEIMGLVSELQQAALDAGSPPVPDEGQIIDVEVVEKAEQGEGSEP